MIDDQKIEEYRELLLQTGLAPKTVDRYIAEIDGFVFLYEDDFSDENIEEYSENTNSYAQKKIRRRVVGMFKEWVLYGTRPRRSVHWKGDEREKAPPKEEKPDRRLYWDNMYNRPAVYKDSHSAQWI